MTKPFDVPPRAKMAGKERWGVCRAASRGRRTRREVMDFLIVRGEWGQLPEIV